MDGETKHRVQFDLPDETLQRLDAIKDELDSTRVGVIRNALRVYEEQMKKKLGVRKMVLGNVEMLPEMSQSIFIRRIEDVARELHRYGFSRDQVLQVILSLSWRLLDELCHSYDPPIDPMSPELLITKALGEAMTTYEREERRKEEERRKTQ